MRKGKVILVLAAAICLLAVNSSPASAVTFKSSVTPEAIVAEGATQTLSVGSAAIKCEKVSGESGKSAFPTEQIVLTVVFISCQVNGLGTATIICAVFNFHSNGTVTLGECKIEVFGICKIIIPSQLANNVTYTNNAGSLTVKRASTGLKYTASAGCIGFEKEGKNLEYSGELKIKGKAGAKLEVA